MKNLKIFEEFISKFNEGVDIMEIDIPFKYNGKKMFFNIDKIHHLPDDYDRFRISKKIIELSNNDLKKKSYIMEIMMILNHLDIII